MAGIGLYPLGTPRRRSVPNHPIAGERKKAPASNFAGADLGMNLFWIYEVTAGFVTTVTGASSVIFIFWPAGRTI